MTENRPTGKQMKDTAEGTKKALLVGIQLPRMTDLETDQSLAELSRLVHTLGYDVIGTLSQRRPGLGSATVLGDGKLADLALWTGGTGKVAAYVNPKQSKASQRFAAREEADEWEEEDETPFEVYAEDPNEARGVRPTERADLVIFDNELTPRQMRNLESATGAKVLDRTGVIIEIFSKHARTRAARLQVEIARLKYVAPRLRETAGTSDREGGGIGGKGAGESTQELDRRRIRDRIAELKRELESIQDENGIRRTRRSSENCVALVGYKNAGKSSLMRVMTGSEIYVADKLFATLETTVRPVEPETVPKILMSDTVGFIKKLPHDLVASFRSTLDEALGADLLLFVVDAADPTFRSQYDVTRQVLAEIGATDTPSLMILNKQDQLSAEEAANLQAEFPEAMMLSTRSPEDLKALHAWLVAFFENGMVDRELFIPYEVQGAVGEMRSQMRVLEEKYEHDGVIFTVRSKPNVLTRLREKYSI